MGGGTEMTPSLQEVGEIVAALEARGVRCDTWHEGWGKLEREFEWTLMKSSQLPYPLNYMRFHNPGLAYVLTRAMVGEMQP